MTEVLEIDEEMQELILKNASEEEFMHAARKRGFITIQEDSIIKALNHEIPYEEMNVFGSQLGFDEDIDEELVAVDNPQELEVPEAIMEDDEVTTD